LCLLPAAAHAQSVLTGVVKDTSGAVLPGVTVEAASPVLIEKTRTTVTDESGGYRIVDLRPGVYSLTLSLEGFSTVKREGLELPSNFTMTVNIDLKIGALEETLTVTGSSPMVDVQSTTKSQVLNRETLDAIPTGRTIQGMGQLITGVSLNIPDVGGSRAMQQTYMSAHGMSASQTTVQVDGLMVNGLDGDGAVQNYFNSSMSQEMVYTTSGASADVSGGGVRLNMIPRDGGNKFNGSFFAGYQNQDFQTDNLSDALRARGLKSADGIEKLSNFEASLGGPIRQDKVWFFLSARTFHLNTLPADVFNADGSAGVDPQSINSAQARIIWQISQKNKLAVYNDRIGKNRGAAMTAGFDPATASVVWNSPIYTTGSAKFTSTVTNRLFVEGGFSTNYERYNFLYQPGIEKQRGTPEWYTTINKQDTSLGTTYNAAVSTQLQSPDRYSLAASLSYVTGIHNIKAGVQDSWGNYRRTYQANGDIRAFFQNGVPFQVHALNTPWDRRDQLHKDIGIYAQDAWTMNRLTINYGARWEYFAHGIPLEISPAGRFTAARTFGPIDMPTWKSIAPRFGAVYDVFGTQQTALKFSIGRYEQAGSTGFSETYNPLALTTAALSWTDLNAAGVNCAAAGASQAGCDKIPQGELGCTYLTAGCEINLAQLPAGFGVASLSNFDPNIKRMYNIETSVSVQQELFQRVSVSGGWFHRDYRNLRRRDNILQSFSDYTPFTVFSPIDGNAITYYNVSNAARTRISNLDLTAGSDRKLWYNGIEYSFNVRLPRGLTIFGGGMSEKTIGQLCDEHWNPNLLLYCDQTKSGIPFRTQFKIAGTVPMKYGIQTSFSLQSNPGYRFGTAALNIDTGIVAGPSGQPGALSLANPNGQGTVWLITPTSRYTACPGSSAAAGCVVGALVDPGMTVASLSVPLVAPQTEFGDRLNQLDINIVKTIKFGHINLQPKFDLFNVLNVSPVYAVRNQNYGTAAYLQPSSILVGRVFQLGAVLRF
jgi:hypothetical protein